MFFQLTPPGDKPISALKLDDPEDDDDDHSETEDDQETCDDQVDYEETDNEQNQGHTTHWIKKVYNM